MPRGSPALRLAVALACVALAAGCRPAARQPYRLSGNNVILISIDTLRADRLGCYGYGRGTSPRIDAFAADNLLFTGHTVTITTTLPSHVSMLTGLHPKSHGVLKNGMRVSPELRTLPEVLRDGGYRTGGIVSAYPLVSGTGFEQGFDDYEDVADEVDAARTLERARAWLDAHGDERFFLFLHFFDPHEPYRPPPSHRLFGKGASARYDGEIHFVDEAVGALLDDLRRRGLYEDALIILTADHGESFGEHGLRGHGWSLYEECLHVPLIVHLPGALGAKPARIDHLTSSIDLAPTVLSLLDIGERLPGSGLSLFGEEIAARRYTFAQRRHYDGQDDPAPPGERPGKSFERGEKFVVRGRQWKYFLRTRYGDELYDLQRDPGERRNFLAGEDAAQFSPQRFAERIRRWREDTPVRVAPDFDVSEEARARLRSMGYLQ